jgi:GNAT superfamily N-acetyltransferase
MKIRIFIFIVNFILISHLFGSQSHAVKIEVEGEPTSVVVINPQRQKLQRTLFAQSHPSTDLRLNSAKGQTIDYIERQGTYRGLSYSKLGFRSYPYLDAFELTWSFPASGPDVFTVCQGLQAYNVDRLEEPQQLNMVVSLNRDFDEVPLCNGVLLYQSLILDNLQGLAVLDPEVSSPLLKAIEASGSEQKARYIHASADSEDIAQNRLLQTNGYQLISNILNFNTLQSTHRFYKPLSPENQNFQPNANPTIIWEKDSDDDGSLSPSFGIFVRDSFLGMTLGGLFGRLIQPQAYPSYAHIDAFWLPPSLRRGGVGKVILNHAKKHIKQHGIKHIELETLGCQAPGFYRKSGFTVQMSRPGIFKLMTGTWSNEYVCQLSLTD